ncbi:MAG: cytochrome c [Deltaproteobacteria bacterium]|nr:cytochrome c [Deltaproteobacteria bacterium]
MSDALKIFIFILASIGLYVYFSEVYVPDIKAGGEVAGSAPMSVGESLYKGRGACALCHDAAGGRAPSLKGFTALAESRINDAAYKGSARDVAAYAIESMRAPSLYVVAGFSNPDGLSPMPDATKAPASLTEDELKAVAEYVIKL